MGPKRRFFLSGWVALLLGIGMATATAGVVPEAVVDRAAREGTVRVIVQLRVSARP